MNTIAKFSHKGKWYAVKQDNSKSNGFAWRLNLAGRGWCDAGHALENKSRFADLVWVESLRQAIRVLGG